MTAEDTSTGYAVFKAWHSRGYLPHFDQPGLLQFVTFRLADSLPVSVLKELDANLPKEKDAERRKAIEQYLDSGHGSCALRDQRVAGMLQSSLLHFDTQR